MPVILARVWCTLVGHKWRVLAVNAELAGSDPLVGTFALCLRCPTVWDDLEGQRTVRTER